MKVLCINADSKHRKDKPEIVEGESYTVIGESASPIDKVPHYHLAECKYFYGKDRFIPCSDQENVVLEDVLLTVNK